MIRKHTWPIYINNLFFQIIKKKKNKGCLHHLKITFTNISPQKECNSLLKEVFQL